MFKWMSGRTRKDRIHNDLITGDIGVDSAYQKEADGKSGKLV